MIITTTSTTIIRSGSKSVAQVPNPPGAAAPSPPEAAPQLPQLIAKIEMPAFNNIVIISFLVACSIIRNLRAFVKYPECENFVPTRKGDDTVSFSNLTDASYAASFG